MGRLVRYILATVVAGAAATEARGAGGLSDLHAALEARSRNDPAAIEALLDAGGDPNARRADGSTPLHVAASGWADDPRIVTALLAAGAGPAVRTGTTWHDVGERTPPHIAVRSRAAPEAVEALLGAGADPNAPDGGGCTPPAGGRQGRRTLPGSS